MRTDGSLAMMAGDGEGSFLLRTSALRQGEHIDYEMKIGGRRLDLSLLIYQYDRHTTRI